MIMDLSNISMTQFITFMITLIVIAVVAVIIFYAIKANDSKKPIHKARAKIIEKPQQTSTAVYWVTVELESGERRKMRVFDKKIILAIGDTGIIKYQGQTIIAFSRAK